MKLLIKLLVIAIIGGAMLATAGYFVVPPAAKKAVDEGSRYAFGVPASIGGIGASPGLATTNVGFTDYSLAAPTGFDSPLLTIGRFKLGLGTTSIIGDTKEVGAFVLEDVVLTLEQKGVQTNIVPVLNHLRGLSAGDRSAPETAEDESAAEAASPGPRLRVGEVSIKGISARLLASGIPGLELDETFTVPDYIEDFSELTGEDGMTVAEVAGALVESLKGKALEAADGKVPADVLNALVATMDGGLQGGLDGAIGAAKAIAHEQVQKLQDGAGAALDGATDELQQKAMDALGEVGGDAVKELEGLGGEAIKDLGNGLGGLLGGKKD